MSTATGTNLQSLAGNDGYFYDPVNEIPTTALNHVLTITIHPQ